MLNGLTQIQMQRIVCECLELCGITQNFDSNKLVVSPDRFQALLKRKPRLSVCKPEATSINRIQDFKER